MKHIKRLNKINFDPFHIHFFYWSLYFFILWSKQLVVTSSGWQAGGPGTWADGAAHLTYMSAFAFRNSFPIMHPLFWGKNFTYPFLADLIGGSLIKTGLAIPFVYSALGFIFSISLVILIYKFFHHLFKNGWIATIASSLFFYSGGLGFIQFFRDVANNGFLPTLTKLPLEYTHLAIQKIEWINIISGELVPQRAFLLGLPTGLYILITLWKIIHQKVSKTQLILTGIIAGLLPIIHAHTMIVIGTTTIWVLVISLFSTKKLHKSWLYFLFPAVIIGLPLVLWQTTVINNSFFTFLPGWLANSKQDHFIWFWLKNWWSLESYFLSDA